MGFCGSRGATGHQAGGPRLLSATEWLLGGHRLSTAATVISFPLSTATRVGWQAGVWGLS